MPLSRFRPPLPNVLTVALLLPALGVGAQEPGSGGEGFGAHSLHEWWANRDGHVGIQKALLLVLAEAGFKTGD